MTERSDPRAPWRAARTYEELCAAAARFLAGELEHFPGWGAPDLDEESDALLETLLRCARAGWLTTASQPGRPFAPGHDGRAWAQRAFVCGFAPPAVARRLTGALAAARLWSSGPGGHPVPAGLRDGTPYLFAGHDAAAEERELFADDLGLEGRAALSQCSFVWAIDPVWGRRERLPAVLDAVLP